MALLLAIAAFAVVALYSPPDPASAQSAGPVIGALPTDLTIAENATGNVGSPFTATDPDGGAITWSVTGSSAFTIDSSSGQLKVITGLDYTGLDYTGLDYEDGATRSLMVTATAGADSTSVTVTVTVNNVKEPPGRPAAPAVTAASDSTTSLTVTWRAPTNTGPPITRYYAHYCLDSTGCDQNSEWSSYPSTADTTATIANLREGGTYQVRVRAKNNEGQSPWSAIGTGAASTANKGRVGIAANTPPVIGGPANVTIEVPENTTGSIGGAFSATDADGDTITWSVGGTGASAFKIGGGGELTLASGVTLDYETQTSYSIAVIAGDGTDTDSAAVTVTVTDVAEPPGKPGRPGYIDIDGTKVETIWDETLQTNTGPALGDHRIRFKPVERYPADPAWRPGDEFDTDFLQAS